ncbi:MAG: shikimate kinase [Salinivenus sp.]
MRIYLTGFMASGKSTIGPRLAARWGAVFWDLDRLIQAHDGRSIPSIFEADGEAAFRRLESEALRRTTEVDDLVVALGGGALADDANWAFVREHGHVVYLEVAPDTILARVEDEAGRRPLLQGAEGAPLPRDQMRDRIEELLSARRARYEAADVTVDATDSPEAVTEAAVRAVEEHGWA